MKKYILCIAGYFFAGISQNAYAQVGIRTTTPHSSAILDIDVSALPINNKKGLLIPRIALLSNIDVVTIEDPADGLMVYNTNSVGVANRVFANNVYMWTGSIWEEYPTYSGFVERMAPDDVYLKSTQNYQFTTGSIPTLSQYNSGTLAPITWETASIIISNPDIVEPMSDLTSFKIVKKGHYDISGFINYTPNISSSSASTGSELILQTSTDNGGTWQNAMAVSTTYEKEATGISQTITIPFTILPFEVGDRFRFALSKPSGLTNHSASAGITLDSGISSKSFRISFLR